MPFSMKMVDHTAGAHVCAICGDMGCHHPQVIGAGRPVLGEKYSAFVAYKEDQMGRRKRLVKEGEDYILAEDRLFNPTSGRLEYVKGDQVPMDVAEAYGLTNVKVQNETEAKIDADDVTLQNAKLADDEQPIQDGREAGSKARTPRKTTRRSKPRGNKDQPEAETR